VVGGGPAGLSAALYLARFKRRFLMVDEGAPGAAWIPESHNIPFFAEGIPGPEILARQRGHVGRYGVDILPGSVAGLRKPPGGPFEAEIEEKGDAVRQVRARRVLLVGLVRRGPPVKTADVLEAAQVQAPRSRGTGLARNNLLALALANPVCGFELPQRFADGCILLR